MFLKASSTHFVGATICAKLTEPTVFVALTETLPFHNEHIYRT